MAGNDDASPGYKRPTEMAFEQLAGSLGGGPAIVAKRLYERLSASSGSGKFEFSIEEMKQLQKEFETEREAFRNIRRKNDENTRQLTQLASDPASELHYEAAKEHYSTTFAKAIEDQYMFCHAYCEAIKLAIDTKEVGEDAAVDSMRKRERALD